jgi:hypothetical protein
LRALGSLVVASKQKKKSVVFSVQVVSSHYGNGNRRLAATGEPVGGVPRLTALVALAINRENNLIAPPTGARTNHPQNAN